MKYCLIIGYSPNELERDINARIENNWRPQWGICATLNGVQYAQAMVKTIN